MSKILIVGPNESNATGGQAKFVRYIYNSEELKDMNLVFLDITYDQSNKTVLKRILFSLKLFKSLIGLLIKRDIRLIHILSPVDKLGLYEKLLMALISRLFGKKTILNFRSAFDHFYNNISSIEKFIVKMLLNVNSLVMVQSQQLKEYLIGNKIVKIERVKVLYNGIESKKSEAIDKKKKDNVITVSFLGEFGYRKGADLLFKVAERLDEKVHFQIEYLIVGPYDKEVLAANNKLRQKKINNIKLLGPIFGKEKETILSNSDVFFLPTRREGFPNAILEAMINGLPVVSTKISAIPEIIKEEENGFLTEVHDIDTMAHQIEKLAENKELRVQMSKKNIEKVEKEFAIDVIMKQLKEIYKEQLLD